MRLLKADQTLKKPVGILCDILVKIDFFIFPTNFLILDCEVEFQVPIIFGRPFISIGRNLVDMELGLLMFKLNNDMVSFYVC